MIQVDDMPPVPPVARNGQAKPFPAKTGDLPASDLGAPDVRPLAGDEFIFVSPAAAPFPRVFPGL